MEEEAASYEKKKEDAICQEDFALAGEMKRKQAECQEKIQHMRQELEKGRQKKASGKMK